MRPNIPYNGKIFLKMLAISLAITLLIFLIAVLVFDYELTRADIFCSPFAAVLAAYLLHLMAWNPGPEREDQS